MVLNTLLADTLQVIDVIDNLILYKILGLNRLPFTLCEMIPRTDNSINEYSTNEVLPARKLQAIQVVVVFLGAFTPTQFKYLPRSRCAQKVMKKDIYFYPFLLFSVLTAAQ